MPRALPIFDGHNDALLRLGEAREAERAFLEGGGGGHLDLPRALQGGLAGGLFACFVPGGDIAPIARYVRDDGTYEVPLAPALEPGPAREATLAAAARLFRLERASAGRLRVCRSVPEIRASMELGVLAAVLHLEGAEALDEDLDLLEILWQAGLRSLGPLWSRPNAFGSGVPFRYPGSPDVGPGLSRRGLDLVRECNRLGVLVDLSHLNAAGFWDVARLSSAPLVASHSNAHALTPVPRNLTDDQLEAIRDSGGLVGVNFAVTMLRPDGLPQADTPLEQLVRHFDHLLARLGEDGVGFGSDFDGTTVPAEVGDAAGLPRVVAALRDHGYDEALLRKLAFENWLRVLELTFAGTGSS